ncbi:rod shape-determining protein MreC [Rhizobacter sp. SG703]|uniref:rod shape-determining protein MreC n=1 Tax=Rhizobacter sp. SG703 TaxID=2587140 RepID=UPI00144635DD|nr:rod shape-determining protein MreC [Rhizobacter sp. SG703]NKI96425.1 rod shape-determining protein MreC [Rhizobacter sp. SG703]
MPLGTLDRTPPPFFRQGPSALTRLMFFSALALFLMVADTRFKLTQPVRAVLATVLNPVERALRAPVDAVSAAGDYAMGLQDALSAEARARRELAEQAARSARVEQLEQENLRLRALLDLRPGLKVRSQTAEVLYDAPDPYSRKVIIDRGTQQGIAVASPVINEAGVLGQVTRAFPYSAEVTLLTDKDAAIPVLNMRTQVRSAAFGNSTGAGLELRFMAGNADVQVGDVLATSGVDGVYPSGIPVAKVVSVDRRVDTGFARIALTPVAQPDAVRHVLVLEPLGVQMQPKPEPAIDPNAKPGAASGRKGPRR